MDPVQLPALTRKSIALFGAVAPRCYKTDGILAKDPFNMTQTTLLENIMCKSDDVAYSTQPITGAGPP